MVIFRKKVDVEAPGIDPGTSLMLSECSTNDYVEATGVDPGTYRMLKSPLKLVLLQTTHLV